MTKIVRLIGLLAVCIPLDACSSQNNGGDWMAMLRVLRDSWENRNAPVSIAEASAIPFATMGVRIGDGGEQVIVLATDTAGERLWTSAARIAITTRGGRIVRTAGLTANLSGYVAGDGQGASWLRAHAVTWVADFADLGVYSAAVECQDTPFGRETTTILGSDIDTIRVDETCKIDQLDWSFKNTYWVSAATGRVWRSVQYIHPKMDSLEIEILRPPLTPQ